MPFYRPPGHVLSRIPLRADGSIRLTALLAGTGVFTRKQLRRAKPTVDGVQMASSDAVTFEHGQTRRIDLDEFDFVVREDRSLTLAMYKPQDVVTTHSHDEGLRIFDILPEWLFAEHLAPVGRLDKDTTGLILLTEDGQLNQRMRHPSRALLRRYHALLARPVEDARVKEALEKGITLRDGHTVHPAELSRMDGKEERWSVALGEGKYHEVRRLFAALGSHVENLFRIGYGPFMLRSAPIDLSDMFEDGVPLCTAVSKENDDEGIIELRDGLMRIDGEARDHLYDMLQLEDEVRMIEICIEGHA